MHLSCCLSVIECAMGFCFVVMASKNLPCNLMSLCHTICMHMNFVSENKNWTLNVNAYAKCKYGKVNPFAFVRFIRMFGSDINKLVKHIGTQCCTAFGILLLNLYVKWKHSHRRRTKCTDELIAQMLYHTGTTPLEAIHPLKVLCHF